MNYKISLIALLVATVMFSAVAFARSSGGARCTIINSTGCSISALYIKPLTSVTENKWESCLEPNSTLDEGDSVVTELPRHRTSNFFDLRCEYADGKEDIWYGIELYDSTVVSLKPNGEFFTKN